MEAAAVNDQIVFTVEGTGVVAKVVNPDNNRFAGATGIALPPGGPAGRSPAIAVHGMGIPTSASNTEAAAKCIEWAVSADTVTKIAMAQAFPDFTTASVADNEEVIAKYPQIHPDFLSTRIEALDLAIGHYRPLIPEWPALGQAIGESVNAAINGLMTPEEALEQADADMRDIMGQ